MLLGLAAKQLGVPLSRAAASAAGVVSVESDASKSVTYGALLGDKPFSAPNTGRAPLKPVTEYQLVGKPVQRKDTRGQGARARTRTCTSSGCPGCCTAASSGRTARGRTRVADKVLSVDESSIKKHQGREGRPQGRLHRRRRCERAGRDPGRRAAEGEVVRVEDDARLGQPLEALPRGQVGRSATRATPARSTRAWRAAAKTESAELLDLLPVARVVRPLVRRRRRHARARPTSGARARASTAAATSSSALLGVPFQNVTFHFAEGAGCYGKNLQDDAALAAALLSQLSGKPVRVQLTRDQEHGWDFYGPATLVDIRGAVDADGKITAYDYVSYQQAWVSSEATELPLPVRPLPLGGFGGADTENAGSQYKITNHRILGRSVPNDSQLPKVAYLRAPAAPQALFASEQMIDELAVAAGMDLGRLPQAEHRELPLARRCSRRRPGSPAGSRACSGSAVGKGRIKKGRGIAIGGFASTFAGIVAEIEVDTVTGKIRDEARLRRARLRPDHQPEHGRAAGRRLRRSRASAAR